MKESIQNVSGSSVVRQSRIRRFLLGSPLHTGEASHQRINKIIALPVFSSDALSSVAYATQESMISLAIAGPAFFAHTFQISAIIVFLLTLLTISYNQTIHAYPGGGGAYIVARDNLGMRAAEIAAVALLTDYILTVAVSVSSGVDALLSAYQNLDHLPIRLAMDVTATLFIMLMNLRGIKESGSAFALPTYVFVGCILTLIGIGLYQWNTFHGVFPHMNLLAANPEVKPYGIGLHIGTSPIGQIIVLWILLHAFASGCTALTGVEAISNGIPAFKPPESKNAAITMRWMAVILGVMFLGISFLAERLAMQPPGSPHLFATDSGETVISQIADAVIGRQWFYYVIQWSTFLILILAANTSFADFPRLSAIAAKDRHLPRWFSAVGDRLVYQNGIIVLAMMAIVLQLAFKGSTNALIPLYAIGVFVAFTFSQSGMVVRWVRMKSPGWRWRSVINGMGALMTGVVALVFAVVKFKSGAWLVLVLMPIFVVMLTRIDRHYEFVRRRLRLSNYHPTRHPLSNAAIVLISQMDDGARVAVEYARLISPRVSALHLRQSPTVTADLLEQWQSYAPDVTLQIADDRSGGWQGAVMDELYYRRKEDCTQINTVVIPRGMNLPGHSLIHRQVPWLLKWMLLNEPAVVVADTSSLNVPVSRTVAPYREATRDTDQSFSLGSVVSHACVPSAFRSNRHTVLLLVAGLHRGVIEAIDYARQMGSDVRALHIELEPARSEELRDGWDRWAGDIPLIICESPYRQLREPLMQLVEATRRQHTTDILTVVIPEFVAPRFWDKALHNQSGLLLKFALQHEPDVVVVNLRYFLDR